MQGDVGRPTRRISRRACVGDKPGYTTILDVPAKDAAIGPLTGALGITAVPETLIVDGKGIVRFHYIGAHDFASPGLALLRGDDRALTRGSV